MSREYNGTKEKDDYRSVNPLLRQIIRGDGKFREILYTLFEKHPRDASRQVFN
jgi:hypothetical protein